MSCCRKEGAGQRKEGLLAIEGVVKDCFNWPPVSVLLQKTMQYFRVVVGKRIGQWVLHHMEWNDRVNNLSDIGGGI